MERRACSEYQTRFFHKPSKLGAPWQSLGQNQAAKRVAETCAAEWPVFGKLAQLCLHRVAFDVANRHSLLLLVPHEGFPILALQNVPTRFRLRLALTAEMDFQLCSIFASGQFQTCAKT